MDNSTGLIVLGVVLLVLAIILGHFFPNRYWIALIAVGIFLMVLGAIFLVVPGLLFIAPALT